MSLTPEQFEARKSGIGASEVAAVCGLSPHDQPVNIWAVKRGLIGPKEETEPMEIGSLQEDTIATLFARRTGGRVISVAEFCESSWAKSRFTPEVLRDAQDPESPRRGVLFHPDTAPVFASCDRIAEFQNELVVCELKNVGFTNREKWGKIGEDKYPLEYLIQVQTQLYVTGLEVGFLCALIGGNDFRYYRIERDPDLWRMCLDRCRTFWDNHVFTGEAPGEINESDAWKAMILARFPDAGTNKKDKRVIPDDDALFLEGAGLKLEIGEKTKALEIIKTKIIEQVGNGYQLSNALAVATLVKPVKGRKKINMDALMLEIPKATVDKHTTIGAPGKPYLKFVLEGEDEE